MSLCEHIDPLAVFLAPWVFIGLAIVISRRGYMDISLFLAFIGLGYAVLGYICFGSGRPSPAKCKVRGRAYSWGSVLAIIASLLSIIDALLRWLSKLP